MMRQKLSCVCMRERESMRMHLYGKVSLVEKPGVVASAVSSLCVHVAIIERKPLSGSCVVWMLRPLSTAGQDALS